MFHLVNKYGNVHKIAKDARKRDELIANGYTLVGIAVVEEPVEEPAVDGVAPYNGPQQADEPQQVDDPLQMHTTEDDTQAVKDPESATAPEPEPEDKEPKLAKSPKTTGGKSPKGATKSTKAKKTAEE